MPFALVGFAGHRTPADVGLLVWLNSGHVTGRHTRVRLAGGALQPSQPSLNVGHHSPRRRPGPTFLSLFNGVRGLVLHMGSVC